MNALFRRVRRGIRLRWAARGIEAAAAAGLVYGLAGLVVDRILPLSASARLAGLAGLAAVVGLVLVWKLASSAAGRIGPVYLASRVESSYPAFADRLISAVELACRRSGSSGGPARPDGRGGGAGTSGPAALVYRQADELAREVEPRRVVVGEAEPTSVHYWLVGAMAATLVAAGVMHRDFSRQVTRCLFPWLDVRRSSDALFEVRPREVRIREGERFFVWGKIVTVSGEGPARVTLELEAGGPGESSILMERSAGKIVWTAEAGPVERSGTFRLRAEFAGGREDLVSDRFPVTLMKTPRAGSVRVTYTYPPYARQPPRTQEGGAVDALIGTEVTVEVTPNTPLSRADFRGPGGRKLKMNTTARRSGGGARRAGSDRKPGMWSASFTLRRSGSYEVTLTSAEGVAAEPRSFPVVARSDAAPVCDAVYEEPSTEEARAASAATPAGGQDRQAVEEALARGARFRVRASDDLGLEELVLVVRRGEPEEGTAAGPPPRATTGPARDRGAAGAQHSTGPKDAFYFPVPGFERGKREADIAATIPPQVMPLEPGVTYTYYVRAADGFVPDPHLASSTPRTFRISRPKDERLLSKRRRKKKRPPLLEPNDDLAESPSPPRGGSSGEGGSGGSPPPGGRRLAGLRDPPGGRPPPPPDKGESGDKKESAPGEPSRYASGPGLQAEDEGQAEDDGRKDEDKGEQASSDGSGGSDGGKGKGSEGRGEQASSGGPGGKADLPGQGDPRAGGGGSRSASSGSGAGGSGSGGSGAGGTGAGGSGAGGAGRTADTAGPPRAGGPGGGTQAPSGGSDTGETPGGGGRGTGLPDERPVDGGPKTGAETGTGGTPPETVDRSAVDALDVTPDEIAATSVPGGSGDDVKRRDVGSLAGMTGSGDAADAGEGRRREVGDLASRDTFGGDGLRVRKDDLPTYEVIRARPVARAYRALVGEYFRRLRELADEADVPVGEAP